MNRLRLMLAGLLLSGLGAANTIIVINGVDGPPGFQQQAWLHVEEVSTQQYWMGGIDLTLNAFSRLVWCAHLTTDTRVTTGNLAVNWLDTPLTKREGWLMKDVQVPLARIDGESGDAPGAGRITQSTDPAKSSLADLLTLASSSMPQSEGTAYTSAAVDHNTDTDGAQVQR